MYDSNDKTIYILFIIILKNLPFSALLIALLFTNNLYAKDKLKDLDRNNNDQDRMVVKYPDELKYQEKVSMWKSILYSLYITGGYNRGLTKNSYKNFTYDNPTNLGDTAGSISSTNFGADVNNYYGILGYTAGNYVLLGIRYSQYDSAFIEGSTEDYISQSYIGLDVRVTTNNTKRNIFFVNLGLDYGLIESNELVDTRLGQSLKAQGANIRAGIGYEYKIIKYFALGVMADISGYIPTVNDITYQHKYDNDADKYILSIKPNVNVGAYVRITMR